MIGSAWIPWVRPERMLANLNASGGVVFSQRVLLALVDAGMGRDEAYRVVQAAAMRAVDGEGGGFRSNLEGEPEVRKRIPDLAPLFDPAYYLEHLDVAFDRLHLGVRR